MAPWALPLAERKTNPHPPPQKNLHGKSTVHTKYSLKKKTSPPNSPPTSHPAIGNSLGEHIENLGNNLGTCRNTSATQKKKKTSPPFPPKPKLKSWGP